jgi:hypothetical protein
MLVGPLKIKTVSLWFWVLKGQEVQVWEIYLYFILLPFILPQSLAVI